MLATVSGLAVLLAAAVPVLAHLLLTGFAVRTLCRGVPIPDGLGVTAGLGLAVTGCVLTLGFVLFRTLQPLVWLLPVLAGLIVLTGLLRQGWAPLRGWRRAATGADLAGLVGGLLLLAPVWQYSTRYWTTGIDDFPSYAASVGIWLNEASGQGTLFRDRHPDLWGEWVNTRGLAEKPVVTAVMVLLTSVTFLPPTQQLTVLVLLFLAVGTAAMVTLVREEFCLSPGWAAAAALPSAMAAAPAARIYDAQPGQAAVVALAGVFLVLVRALGRARGWYPVGAAVLLTGITLAALLGSNVSLALALGPALTGLGGYLLVRAGLPVRAALIRLALAGAVAVPVCVPLLPLFIWSLSLQAPLESMTTHLPMHSPLGLFGLDQVPLYSPSLDKVLTWGLFLVLLAMAWWAVMRPDVPRTRLVAASAGLVLANALVLLVAYHPDSYRFNKWMAAAFPLVGPFVLGAFLAAARGRTLQGVRVFAGYATVAAVAISTQNLRDLPHVSPPDTPDLATHPTLRGLDTVNIDLMQSSRPWVLTSIVALTVPSRHVVVVSGDSFTGISAPSGHWFLVEADAQQPGEVLYRQRLTPSFDLVRRRVPLPWGTTAVHAGTPEVQGLLHGRWHIPEETGVWSADRGNYLSFDLPPDAVGPVEVTVHGTRYLPDGDPRPLQVAVFGAIGSDPRTREDVRIAEQVIVTAAGPDQLTVVVPPSKIVDGQVTLEIRAPDPVQPERGDERHLGFQLTGITLTPAG